MTNWIQAARLRTLPLSISGIIIGSFTARWRLLSEGSKWDWQIFALAMLVTTLYQILSNFANDYGDGIKGTDRLRTKNAEIRMVTSGKISVQKMKSAVIITAGLSLLATIALIYKAFIPNYLPEFFIFLGLGILCILAAIGYTIGKNSYGYMGLGDVMVFIFFGIVSVGGSYFLFTKTWSWDILLPASAVGMLSTAVLNLNNMRDMESDRLSGKKTFALRIGFRNAMIYQIVLMQLPLIFILIFLMMNNLHTKKGYYPF
ncbi:MAG: 1,4-dihydroxy-2-naphthoate octaprenyltransferase, partial [Riemerella sp.]|nr:1,4-dihydroxy-2-naphthoate octaprenyltransferase [Riemerella sp.]